MTPYHLKINLMIKYKITNKVLVVMIFYTSNLDPHPQPQPFLITTHPVDFCASGNNSYGIFLNVGILYELT